MDDVWWHVLALLGPVDRLRLERVCRQWRSILRRFWLQQVELDLDFICPDSVDHDAVAILILEKCGGSIRSLILGGRQLQPPEWRQNFSSKRELTGDLVMNIVELCPHLVNLTIRRYRIIRPDVLAQLANLPTSLEHLRIESCLVDLRINAEILLRQLLLNIFARCSHLRTFAIVGRGSCYGYLVIDGELLAALPQSMEHLFISAGDSLKLDNLHFLRRLPHLQTLSAQRSYIGEEDLALLADCCPNLEHLDLSHSRRIFNFHNIAQCDRLRQLIVDGNRDYFSDHHLRAIVRGCPLLEELSVETCAQLTELGLVEIGRCRRLKKLSLWGLGCVNDTVMLAIASGCTLIEYLDLKYCRKITSLGLSGLLRLTELRTLFVSGIEDFDREMAERLREATKLEKLEANDCRLSKCLDWERQARMIKQMAETALPIARLDS